MITNDRCAGLADLGGGWIHTSEGWIHTSEGWIHTSEGCIHTGVADPGAAVDAAHARERPPHQPPLGRKAVRTHPRAALRLSGAGGGGAAAGADELFPRAGENEPAPGPCGGASGAHGQAPRRAGTQSHSHTSYTVAQSHSHSLTRGLGGRPAAQGALHRQLTA
eukprot:1119191-Prorocentrum_minimum.AAC.1